MGWSSMHELLVLQLITSVMNQEDRGQSSHEVVVLIIPGQYKMAIALAKNSHRLLFYSRCKFSNIRPERQTTDEVGDAVNIGNKRLPR